MKLNLLIKELNVIETIGNTDIDIKGVNIDSRLIEEGHMFIAVKGTQADGHNYINTAIEKGAKAILCEVIPQDINPNITYIKIENTETNVGQVATTFYGNPSQKLHLVGVTGTNGKTTIATTLYNLFRQMGHHAGLLSTVVNCIDGKDIHTEHTTPDPITLPAQTNGRCWLRVCVHGG